MSYYEQILIIKIALLYVKHFKRNWSYFLYLLFTFVQPPKGATRCYLQKNYVSWKMENSCDGKIKKTRLTKITTLHDNNSCDTILVVTRIMTSIWLQSYSNNNSGEWLLKLKYLFEKQSIFWDHLFCIPIALDVYKPVSSEWLIFSGWNILTFLKHESD